MKLYNKPIDGMFLSSNLLQQLLLEDNSRVRVTEELYNLFVDVLHFHEEYPQLDQQQDDKLPKILFCKP